ncbi:MAG: sorbitol-6-phosphate dehydrogenase [Spirochaetes bacterium]|nr:MAG: sorbitol-6-phosphate dehydrogenase [Spirochaetota bacterium]RKY02288.1 MAG: sorbitol-6-phosphate dehydrogenase [Spirochaetota bacterium]
MYNLEGKNAIVTGGGQGLGEAICHKLAENGINVTVADLNYNNATKVAGNIAKKYSIKSLPLKVDVTNSADVENMVKKTVESFGRLDILVSNAGILYSYEVTEFPEEQFRRIINVNLIGFFLCAKEAAKIMKEQKSGVIIQINSKSGKRGSYKNSAYSASKFGGIGFTQSIALDLAPYNVRVNAICPGNLLDSPLWVNSLYKQYAKKWGITEEEVRQRYINQVPLKRGCTYDDVTAILLFLISDGASYMTGQAINVTGGQVMD